LRVGGFEWGGIGLLWGGCGALDAEDGSLECLVDEFVLHAFGETVFGHALSFGDDFGEELVFV